MSDFKKIKVGDRVKDTWYGYGTVKAKLKTRLIVQLDKGQTWSYDLGHINTFVRAVTETKASPKTAQKLR